MSAIVGVCKFCRCTDENPCTVAITTSGGELAHVYCAWITDDVCSAPGCVERAYLEARLLAEDLIAIVANQVKESAA